MLLSYQINQKYCFFFFFHKADELSQNINSKEIDELTKQRDEFKIEVSRITKTLEALSDGAKKITEEVNEKQQLVESISTKNETLLNEKEVSTNNTTKKKGERYPKNHFFNNYVRNIMEVSTTSCTDSFATTFILNPDQ